MGSVNLQLSDQSPVLCTDQVGLQVRSLSRSILLILVFWTWCDRERAEVMEVMTEVMEVMEVMEVIGS